MTDAFVSKSRVATIHSGSGEKNAYVIGHVISRITYSQRQLAMSETVDGIGPISLQSGVADIRLVTRCPAMVADFTRLKAASRIALRLSFEMQV